MKVLDPEQRPLHGLRVLDFSQFLSGPLCSLRLADLGATVTKVEREGTGDLCRNLYISDTDIGGANSLFHAINRNKQSLAVDLRKPEDKARLQGLIPHVDVVIQNFRPGVIERLGFGHDDVRKLNPSIIYGSISGYGESGPWKDLPGQDLLAPARSGLLWLTGDRDHAPMPMGLAAADMMAGNVLAQGILAALVRRGITGQGALVQTSLFEAMLDFQFEVLTTYLNDGHRLPQRSALNGAHAYLGAPYGVYRTSDGWLALAMIPSLERLCTLLGITSLERFYGDQQALMTQRDVIKAVLAERLLSATTQHWLSILQPADIWCSQVLDWAQMRDTDAYRILDMEQQIVRDVQVELHTLRSPIRIDGATLKSPVAAPVLGQDNARVWPDR